MKNIHRNKTVRMLAAILVAVTVMVLSALASHAPAQNQSSLTLNRIRTDNAAVFVANRGPACAWFVEMVLPTDNGKLAAQRPSCAWFVEMVLPTGEGQLMTEKLQSVAATL